MVTGSLLGMAVGEGVLEITHAFSLPDAAKGPEVTNNNKSTDNDNDQDGTAGYEYQLEMMRMLREVNVDNNCVGWYQSMYLGSYSTSSFLESQLSYQTDLSPNAVVLLYDPMQTSHGNLVLKCFRLTQECVDLQSSGKNTFLDPSKIFEAVPVEIINPGLTRVLLNDIQTGQHGTELVSNLDTTFDRLDLSTNPYLEKHLEFLCTWVDDLAAEQQKFQYYARNIRRRKGHLEDTTTTANDVANKTEEEKWEAADAPRRMESLLVSNQIRNYCDQMDKFAGGGFSKLFLAGGLHKEERTTR